VGTFRVARGSSGAVFKLAPSNRAAIDVVFEGRTVCCVEDEACRIGEEICRVGDAGASGAVVVPRVFSHDGGLVDALLVVACRSGV
jgi:hypothetical protein